ncbi:MAG: threonylcarbamoyl-AMP synthase [Zetaproteobacteria bacterium]|nr:threonylcarbamoyl-AMP synthase [Pseudobdellovibrionaceae bacterium]|tara:strand:+ start:1107 stop:1730 length:624 start_codon:yes stop_codon:yes gene_type:complete
MAEHLYTYIDPPSKRHLDKACGLLADGKVICYPTGTSWAFGCDASSSKGLDKLHLLNPMHPKEKSLSLICNSISMASNVGNIDHQLYRILKKIWPGPYTVIVKRNRTLPRQIKDKRPVVGIRIPDNPLVIALVEKYGHPLATTSVPLSAEGAPYKMGFEIFDKFSHALDLLLDLGEELPGTETTVVDFSDGFPDVVRVGAGDVKIFG